VIERQKELARRLYMEVFGAGNLAAADDILSPDCVARAADAPPRVGTDGIKQQAVLLRTAIPDLAVSLEDQVAEDDRVVSRWRGTGTHSGDLRLPTGTVPPTGSRIDFGEIRIDRFEGGRIVESWFIPDRLALWRQLGLVPDSNRPSPAR
jgi:predicted ester cyclase